MGTVCGINLYQYGTEKLYQEIFERIREIDQTMSAREGIFYHQLSSVIEINKNAGIAPVKTGNDLLDVLEKAKYIAELSNGAFDPTIGPLVNLWGIGTDNERIPNPDEITQALSLINWQDLIIDREQGTAFLRRPGMELDLGGIVKGYAADEAAQIIKEAEVDHAVIDLSGNILAVGNSINKDWRGNNIPWRIGIQAPLKERGEFIGILSIADKTVVTSGVYERFFEFDGIRYHHILSTENGYPVDKGLLSVSIVTNSSIDADGFSTAVFALGFEQGLALLETIPDTGAIFIFDDQSVYITDNLKEIFTLTNDEYTVHNLSAQ